MNYGKFSTFLYKVVFGLMVVVFVLTQSAMPINAVTTGEPSPTEAESSIEDSNMIAVDPDRDSTVPTGWVWWKHRTESEINSIRNDDDMRLIDLEVAPTNDGRYDVVFVQNSGEYQRSDGWWYGFDRNGVVAKIDEIGGRITDLEPYTVNGQRRFAFSTVRNGGDANKAWWWNYDLTPEQVTADINTHEIRLVDLDVYLVNGQTRYSYVGIRNQGADQLGWWWYPDVSAQFVTDRINEHGARLVDIERHSNGNFSAIMVENLDGTSWWWGTGASQTWMEETVATTASRIIDVESTMVNGERIFDFISIDNANTETRRLRELIYQAYDAPEFGNQEVRGFLVKEVGGDALADQAGDFRFQPLSTLKLLPYLYAMIEIDNGQASMSGSTASWIETTVDNPDTDIDDRRYVSCLQSGAANTQSGSAPFTDALPTMMWESHNRTLDYFLEAYGPTNITSRVQQLGLTKTEMHFGCPQPNDSHPWAANRSTLYDITKIYEGVEQLQFVSNPSTRNLFFENMINRNYAGASYTSPITDRRVGPLNVSFLRGIVEREAGIAKQGIVEDFLQQIVLRGKGGSGGPNSNEIGFSDSLHVTLPFKENGQTVLRTFVTSWFVYKLQTPSFCLEKEDPVKVAECSAIRQPEQEAMATFTREIHAAPIRMALETWDLSEIIIAPQQKDVFLPIVSQ